MSIWASIISEFKVMGGITFKRFGQADWVDGFPVEPAPVEFHVDPVALHPLMLRIDFMGEFKDAQHHGFDTTHKFVVYTLERLHPARPGDGIIGDRFDFDGDTFEIEAVQPWLQTRPVDTYYKSLASKVDTK